jgi:hypothetical protein
MVEVRVQVTGVADVIAALEEVSGRKLKSTTARVMGQGARSIVAPAIAAATPHRFGGHAGPNDPNPTRGLLSKRSQITSRQVRLRPQEIAAVSIKPRSWFYHMVAGGTKPHIVGARGVAGIAPRGVVQSISRGFSGNRGASLRGQALFFKGIYATVVHHPGSPPNPYVAQAAQGVGGQIAGGISTALQKELDKHAK